MYVCMYVRSPPAWPPFKGQGTEHTTVKWPILLHAGNVWVLFDYREHAPPKGEMPDSLLTTSWLAGWCKCLCSSVKGMLFRRIFHSSPGARGAGMIDRVKYEN